MRKYQSRLLASVSSLGCASAGVGGRSDGPMLLLAAVCGSAFSEKEADLATASRYAATAIEELGVFGYLLDYLKESKQMVVAVSVRT